MAENVERIQRIRDKAVVNMSAGSGARKAAWDKKAQVRQFEKGDRVYLRKSGTTTKLTESWAGPYTIVKWNSPLSYKVNTRDRTIASVHVQLLKQYTPREGVRRATTVLEPDADTDSMEHQYTEVTLSGEVETDTKEEDVKQWESEYSDILTKDLGLTNLAEFKIKTGDHPPICQGPYNIPQSLVDSVNKELKWLLDKGFIRESTSSWASPMVTVKKPDGSARICIDFKAINAITTPLPFYMPWVEEVLEHVGKSKVISKLDLTKGYHQVHMSPGNIQKTVFVCHQEKYEFLRMPFGVRSAPAVVQELMQNIFRKCRDFCSPYMDDLVIYSVTWEEHKVHVKKVLQCLREAGLTANPAKCHWGGTRGGLHVYPSTQGRGTDCVH